MPKPCDACQGSHAVVYCRADAAYLCIDCDAKVHGANKLASRHERVLMCEVCELTPAVVTCKADAAALCVACDADIHSANPLAKRHERVPVQPFYDSPNVVKVRAVLNDTEVDGPEGLLRDDEDSSVAEAVSWLLPNPKVLDGVVPPLEKGPQIVVAAGRIDECCLSSTPGLIGHSFQVPKLEKEKAGGKARHEHHGGADLFHDVDPYLDLDYASAMGPLGADSMVPVHHPAADSHSPSEMSNASPSVEGSVPVSHVGYNYGSGTLSHSMSSSSLDARIVPDSVSDISNPYDGTRGGFEFPPRMVRVGQMEPMAREARVLRYKEKRKNRKFEKTIRYASRKAYAESRPRIKGRFAKRTDPDTEQMYSLVPDAGFGVVPSF